MKKFILLFALNLVAVYSNANPVYMPIAYVNKFFFDENKDWEIIVTADVFTLDSILISSSSGKSICKKLIQSPLVDYSIKIRNDSLESDLTINPEGDSISLNYYYNFGSNTQDSTSDYFVYGDYRNAFLSKPITGQSIKRILINSSDANYYCKCDSSDHCGGLLQGHIYDKNNNLITKGHFSLSPIPEHILCWDFMSGFGVHGIDINNDGTYSASLYSVIYNLSSIKNCIKRNCAPASYYYSVFDTVRIAPLNFAIEPDSTLELDIHLLDDFVGIKKVETTSVELLKIFPSPLANTSFYYEINVPVKSTSCDLDLLNISGQLLMKYKILENSGELNLPSDITNGIYFFQLHMNGKLYFSKQVIVDK
jgi:hypothetical protein